MNELFPKSRIVDGWHITPAELSGRDFFGEQAEMIEQLVVNIEKEFSRTLEKVEPSTQYDYLVAAISGRDELTRECVTKYVGRAYLQRIIKLYKDPVSWEEIIELFLIPYLKDEQKILGTIPGIEGIELELTRQ